MTKTLTRHGNSLALVIDKPILDLLHIDEETSLEVATDGQSLIISPAVGRKRREKIDAAYQDTQRKYGAMLKRLAQ